MPMSDETADIRTTVLAPFNNELFTSWASPDNGILTVGRRDLGAVRALLDQATASLEKEDRWLRRAFAASVHQEAYAARAAPGLAYWVFEHNLVLAIFRDWIKTQRVLWDETATAVWEPPVPDRTRPSFEQEACTQQRYIDLQLLGESCDSPRVLFEAKWFNAPKGKTSARTDWEKLRVECGRRRRKGWRGYMLLFRSGTGDIGSSTLLDLEKQGLPVPSFAGIFSTNLRSAPGFFGLFAVSATESPQPQQRKR